MKRTTIVKNNILRLMHRFNPALSFLLFAFLLSPFTLTAQPLPLSDSATASVITCGPGNDFYLTFGHSAIRIVDPARGIDHVYNYGTFDFDTPHFYWKFARGRLNYCLSRSEFQHFMKVYDSERRAVWEQPLNLTTQEVNNLYVALEWNYLPQNRYYRYDFFRDNCATRVRDMVEAAVGIDDTILYCEEHAGRSYRRIVHQSTAGGRLEWWTMGVDLLLGLPADHRCDVREVMFHPIEMMQTFDHSHLGFSDCGRGNLVAPTRQYLPDVRTPLRRSFPPLLVFSLLFLVVALLSAVHLSSFTSHLIDRLLFILASLVGLVLLFMWFGTDHYCTAWNLHILWASPLLLLIAIRLQRSPRWALWLQEACFLAALLWIILCGLSPAFIPLILTLALRVALLLTKKKR